MSFFLRKVRGAQWDGTSSCDAGWQEKARKDFALREGEETFSLFEATTEEERDRTAAAFALRGRDKKPVDLIEVTAAELQAIGRVEPDGAGDTNLPDVNARHCSLHTTPEALHRLVDALRSAGRVHQRYAWRDGLLPRLRAVDPDKMIGADADEAREWLARVCFEPPK